MASNKEFKILLVDDEEDILEFLSFNLTREGYQVFRASSGIEALKIAKKEKPHLILLDVMMPEMDGMEVCRTLRNTPELQEVLIVFLTARNEDYSQISGFEAGADDYISKPIKPRVFISRIAAILRRIKPEESSSSSLKVGGLEINRERYLVITPQEEVSLPKKEFELLYLLASKPGKVFTREYILQYVWGEDVIVGDRTIDVHIRKLREKFGEEYIKTVKGIGYKFEF